MTKSKAILYTDQVQQKLRLTLGEQAVHLSNAKLTGRTLSNLDKKPRIWKVKKITTIKNRFPECYELDIIIAILYLFTEYLG